MACCSVSAVCAWVLFPKTKNASTSNAAATGVLECPFPPIVFLKNKLYSTGSTMSVSRVAVSKPPITTVAKGRCTSAPAPSDIAIGKKPSDATAAVINTGRNRTFVPLRMRSSTSATPDFSNWLK